MDVIRPISRFLRREYEHRDRSGLSNDLEVGRPHTQRVPNSLVSKMGPEMSKISGSCAQKCAQGGGCALVAAESSDVDVGSRSRREHEHRDRSGLSNDLEVSPPVQSPLPSLDV